MTILLQRVPKGESALLERLIPLLAERLVYVPVVHKVQDSGRTTVSAVTIDSDEGPAIPIFTEESLFQPGGTIREEGYESISLLGADLCAVLLMAKQLLLTI